jgi:hypothetical protein
MSKQINYIIPYFHDDIKIGSLYNVRIKNNNIVEPCYEKKYTELIVKVTGYINDFNEEKSGWTCEII